MVSWKQIFSSASTVEPRTSQVTSELSPWHTAMGMARYCHWEYSCEYLVQWGWASLHLLVSSLCMPQTGALTHFHRGKALVNKLYSSLQALGGMSHFMGISLFQLAPSVHWANYKFSHKHILDPYNKMSAGSYLYQCVQYVLYSAHHAADTFTDCSRLKMG